MGCAVADIHSLIPELLLQGPVAGASPLPTGSFQSLWLSCFTNLTNSEIVFQQDLDAGTKLLMCLFPAMISIREALNLNTTPAFQGQQRQRKYVFINIIFLLKPYPTEV